MKKPTLATISGTTLSGASGKPYFNQLDGALASQGLGEGNRTAITSNATLLYTQGGLVLVDATSGTVTLTLPTSGSNTDDVFYSIRRIDSSSNNVIVAHGGTDTIEGSANSIYIGANGTLDLQMPAGATNWRVLDLGGGTQAGARTMLGFPLRGFIAGLTLSTAGSSATFSVAAGEAADSTNAVLLQLASAISKTTSAWAVGSTSGGLDTGVVANSTWYHVYAIRRPDTAVVDVLFSLSASAPTMPTNYTQKRRIGSLKTNGSAQWTLFVQDGDYFQWDVPVNDVAATSTGTAAVTRTLTAPTGVNVRAKVSTMLYVVSTATPANCAALLSDLSLTDTAPATTANTVFCGKQTNDNFASTEAQVRTNTSAQIRSRCSSSDANITLYITTTGWFDTRGRDA